MTLAEELDCLAGFSAGPEPGVTRIVFTEADRQARDWLAARFADAGLSVRIDAVGNTFARWNGFVSQVAPVATGSHIDAIPHSGRFDGTVGVLGGLEAIRTLQRSGFQPQRSIELIVFTAEEPTRFGIGCLGSRLLSGTLSAAAARDLVDQDGRTLEEVRTGFGLAGDLEDVALQSGAYRAFLELHIEQGPILEREGRNLGVVTAIAAPASLRIDVAGDGGHAGAVLMEQRRDALSGAAEIALAAEQIARSTGSTDSVATTGVMRVFPGAVNSIPSAVTLEVDMRDIDGARRNAMIEGLRAACATVARNRRLGVTLTLRNADAPADCDPGLIEMAEARGAMPMVSRAYHDALFMAKLAPAAMIFIPCRHGYSHRPEEFASPADIAAGVGLLTAMLAELASS